MFILYNVTKINTTIIVKFLLKMESDILQKLIDVGLENKDVFTFAIVVFLFYTLKSLANFGLTVYQKMVKPSDIKDLSKGIKDLSAQIADIQDEIKTLTEKSQWLSHRLSTNDDLTERNKDYINTLKSDIARIQNFIDVLNMKIK